MITIFPGESSAGTAVLSTAPSTMKNIAAISSQHVFIPHPATVGANPPLDNKTNEFDFSPHYNHDDRWGIWIKIDLRFDVYDVKISSSPTGELYAISIWDSLDNDHILVHRSTDWGWNWSVYWEYNFQRDYKISSPGIDIVNDTIIMWYVIHQVADSTWRTWFRACLPGANDSCIYSGSPTGGFNQCEYRDLNLADDYSPYYEESENLYTTWVESFGNGPDSTRVMFARSYELDVGNWELGPTKLYSTAGANIFFAGTDIACGPYMEALWITAWLHPSGYPATYDRSIWGWISTDSGATWSSENILTPMDNHMDEYDPRIAASHLNSNWVILFTQVDTNFAGDRDVGYLYSITNYTWTSHTWVTPYEEYLPDIWVDYFSSAFFGVYRQDGNTFENIQFDKANNNNPSSWYGPRTVTEQGLNLSGIYRPSINYNIVNGDAIVAWTQCENAYQICFTSQSWLNISGKKDSHYLDELVDIIPNPNGGKFKIVGKSNKFDLSKISLYDASGCLVARLKNIDGTPGQNTVSYSNPSLTPGIYFLRIEAGSNSQIRKIVIVD